VTNFSGVHRMIRGLVIALALFLTGCGEQELSSCLLSTEQLILLRQMAMTPKQKEALDFCIIKQGLGVDMCRATYLNANVPVRVCMAEKGFTFTDVDSGFGVCRYEHFRDPECYQSKWFLMLPASIRNEISKPYVPS
jgi:hypothetical protein